MDDEVMKKVIADAMVKMPSDLTKEQQAEVYWLALRNANRIIEELARLRREERAMKDRHDVERELTILQPLAAMRASCGHEATTRHAAYEDSHRTCDLCGSEL